MKKENRYIVIKIKDAETYLDGCEKANLAAICSSINNGRAIDGKQEIECVVVESGWPEYESTWQSIAARVDGAPKYRVIVEQ